MIIQQHPFQTINWGKIEKVKHPGEKGFAVWQTNMMADIRIRMVVYAAGYIADHWCNKGHIILCIKGKMRTELQDGRIMKLKKGMTYHVGDDSEAHRTSSKKGCKLFIVA
ncbi:MAG TPA: DHCW motif cupin fold protein [Chitinophagaceae bacterium]|nr:DHCW motif cupin fold protein [Chitinophagaceae bacterium]